MASMKRKPHPDLAAALRVARTQPEAYGIRLGCMNGEEARLYETNRRQPRGTALVPPVGEFCTAVLENAVDVQRDPARLSATPDQSLLAPHMAIGVARGLPATKKTAIDVIKTFVDAGRGSGSVVPLRPLLPSGAELVLTPGVALDAAYTRTAIISLSKPSSEAASELPDALYEKADACFRNSGITVGECVTVGEQLALNYLAPKPAAMISKSK